MTDADRLTAYLHEHIPLTAAMGVRVLEARPERVRLRAPLGPNLNHRATAFGGSLSGLGILAGWCVMHVRLRPELPEARLVIARSEANLPATGRRGVHRRLRAARRCELGPADPQLTAAQDAAG